MDCSGRAYGFWKRCVDIESDIIIMPILYKHTLVVEQYVKSQLIHIFYTMAEMYVKSFLYYKKTVYYMLWILECNM